MLDGGKGCEDVRQAEEKELIAHCHLDRRHEIELLRARAGPSQLAHLHSFWDGEGRERRVIV